MKKLTSKIALVLAVAVLATTQIYASEEATLNGEVSVTKAVETTVDIKESKISNFLHSCPLISKIFNMTSKLDYVAEDTILTNYMLGTPEEIANNSVEHDVVAEEILLENYMLAKTETEENGEQLALAELQPVAFAADLDEEDLIEDDFDFLQIDFIENDME